ARLPCPDLGLQIPKGHGGASEFRLEEGDLLLATTEARLARPHFAFSFAECVLPRSDGRRKDGREMHAHCCQEGANRTSLLDPRDPVAQHDEPQVFDSKRSEGVLALVKRDEMAHAADRDRPEEIVVLQGAVIAEG